MLASGRMECGMVAGGGPGRLPRPDPVAPGPDLWVHTGDRVEQSKTESDTLEYHTGLQETCITK